MFALAVKAGIESLLVLFAGGKIAVGCWCCFLLCVPCAGLLVVFAGAILLVQLALPLLLPSVADGAGAGAGGFGERFPRASWPFQISIHTCVHTYTAAVASSWCLLPVKRYDRCRCSALLTSSELT